MTDWDQLAAMGQLSALKQREALARAQAARDETLAAQNAEVIKLLREQKEREDREKALTEKERARRASLPQCPDCLSPLERGARKCPHCAATVVQWEYVHPTYAWTIACRTSDLQSLLHKRCWSILKDFVLALREAKAALYEFDSAWERRVEESIQDLASSLGKFDGETRDVAAELLPQAVAKRKLASPDEAKHLRSLLDQVEAKYPALLVMDEDAAARARAVAKIDRLALTVSNAWYERLRQTGALDSSRTLERELRSSSSAASRASSHIAVIRGSLGALYDHLSFGASLGVDWRSVLGCTPDIVRRWRDGLPADAVSLSPSSDGLMQVVEGLMLTMQWITAARGALDAATARVKRPVDG